MADALTKYVGGDKLCRHVYGTMQRVVEGKHELAPSIESVECDTHIISHAIMSTRMRIEWPKVN